MSALKVLEDLRWYVSDGLDDYDEGIRVSAIWEKINRLIEIEKEKL